MSSCEYGRCGEEEKTTSINGSIRIPATAAMSSGSSSAPLRNASRGLPKKADAIGNRAGKDQIRHINSAYI